MIDFTSALYLGMEHPARSLPAWKKLTSGAPIALEQPRIDNRISKKLQKLLRVERAALAPSSLHAFWDVFDVLSKMPVRVYVDETAYPISKWGLLQMTSKQRPVIAFPQHNASAVERLIKRDRSQRTRPIIVTDGWNPQFGKPAPLRDYLDVVRQNKGLLIVDDTQGLGVFGVSPSQRNPFGFGGAGLPARLEVYGPEVITVASLAKGFGVPLAVIAGGNNFIARIEKHGETRVHCSPPSFAHLIAAENALDMNSRFGDALRGRLLDNIRRLKKNLQAIGFATTGSFFPAQSLKLNSMASPIQLHHLLLANGVKTLLLKGRKRGVPRLTFLVTARHSFAEIDQAVDALGRIRAKIFNPGSP